jgi:hypothetical protein
MRELIESYNKINNNFIGNKDNQKSDIMQILLQINNNINEQKNKQNE